MVEVNELQVEMQLDEKGHAVILDPFNGSGTTGVVATMLNRQFIGIDKEEDFLKLTIKRINFLKNTKT